MDARHLNSTEVFEAAFNTQALNLRARAHLDQCAQCRKAAEDYRALETLYKKQQKITQPSSFLTARLKALARESLEDKPRFRWALAWRHPAWASALVVLIVAGLLFETREVANQRLESIHLEAKSPVTEIQPGEKAPLPPASKAKEAPVAVDAPMAAPKPQEKFDSESETLKQSRPFTSGLPPTPKLDKKRAMEPSQTEAGGLGPRDEDALLEAPDQFTSGANAPQDDAAGDLKKARSWQSQGRFREALALYEAVYPRFQGTREGDLILFSSAQCHFELEEYGPALQKLGRLEARFPRYPGLAPLKAKILEKNRTE